LNCFHNQGPTTPHGGRTGVLVRRIGAQGTFFPRTYRCALDPSYDSSKAPSFDAWKNYLFPTLIFFEFRIFHFFCVIIVGLDGKIKK
jgi:hypothetical protein